MEYFYRCYIIEYYLLTFLCAPWKSMVKGVLLTKWITEIAWNTGVDGGMNGDSGERGRGGGRERGGQGWGEGLAGVGKVVAGG
jgi:hypothetical protein